MPMRPKGPCMFPGCPNRAVNDGRCAAHPRPERARASANERGYGAEWRRLRDAHLRAFPLCVECGMPGNHVDHITPRARGGTDDESNLQTLCATHHSQKTAAQDGGFGNRRR